MSELKEFTEGKLHGVKFIIRTVDPEDRIALIHWLMDGFCMECGRSIPEGQGECYCMRED